MAGRPKIFQEEDLLDKAALVFWQKGYANASAKDLMSAMGIGQGSFYLNFKGGKKELFQKSFNRAWKLYQAHFRSEAAKADNPVEFIKGYIRSLIDRSKADISNGCFAGNTIIESSNIDSDLLDQASKLLGEFETDIVDLLVKAKENGQLGQNKSPELLAKFIINFWNGINITLRLNDFTREDLEKMIELNLKVLE